MAITLETATRDAACDAIVDLVDGGAGAGTIEIKTADSSVSGTNEAATLTFSDPAFDAAGTAGGNADGTAAANTITDDTSATGGTAATYTVFDSNSAAIWRGAVATSGSDLNLSSLSIGAGDTVSISSFTLTVPAS